MATLDWDSEIITTSSDFPPLDEGEYPFTVEKFERAFIKSGNNAGNQQADYTLRVTAPNDNTTLVHYRIGLALNQTWKITAWNKALGLIPEDMPEGESFKPDWEGAVGKTAMCELIIKEYKKNDGSIGKTNDVKRIWKAPAQAAAPVEQVTDITGDLPF